MLVCNQVVSPILQSFRPHQSSGFEMGPLEVAELAVECAQLVEQQPHTTCDDHSSAALFILSLTVFS
jgi:hypothetical protein